MALNQSTSDEGQTQCHEDSIRAFQESNLNSKTLGEAPASPDEFLQHCGKKKKKENDAVYVVCPVVLTLSRSPEGSALICLDQCWESIHSFNRLNFWSISCFSQCKISFTRSTPISLFLSPTWLTMTFWSLSQNGVSLKAGPSRVQTAAGPRAPQGAGLRDWRGGPFCWEQELESEPFTDELILWCGAAAAGKTEAWSGRGFTRVLA